LPYSIPSVGPGAHAGVEAVSPQVTVSHPPGGRLPFLSARPAVTSPAAEHHRPLDGTKLHCLVTEAHRYEQLAQGCYAMLPRARFEPATYSSQVQRSTSCTTAPPQCNERIVKMSKMTMISVWALHSNRNDSEKRSIFKRALKTGREDAEVMCQDRPCQAGAPEMPSHGKQGHWHVLNFRRSGNLLKIFEYTTIYIYN